MLLEISFLYVEACALRHAKYKCTKSYLVLLGVLLEADLEKIEVFLGGGSLLRWQTPVLECLAAT